jgi:hypothetical protein
MGEGLERDQRTKTPAGPDTWGGAVGKSRAQMQRAFVEKRKKAMAMRPLTEAAKNWGLNDSTLRKQAGKRFPALGGGHTLFIDDEDEDFLAWLREHVLAQRQKGRWPALVELAMFTLAYRTWPPGEHPHSPAILQQPLEAMLGAVRDQAGGDRLDLEGQAQQACEKALTAFVERPAFIATLCALFFRLLRETYGGSVPDMLAQERLLLFAYAVYQEEEVRAPAPILSARGKGGLALGDESVQVGEALLIQVMGYPIEGRAAYDDSCGWHLVASDKSVVLLTPGMRGRRLGDSPVQVS